MAAPKAVLSFRARAIDFTRALTVYRSDEVPDLDEAQAISRALPQLATGMEKEEEEEHHLQQVINVMSQAPLDKDKKASLYIPIPEANLLTPGYEQHYAPDFKLPEHYIHMHGNAADPDIPNYDMDSEDEAWLTSVNSSSKSSKMTPIQFERCVDAFERSTTGNDIAPFAAIRPSLPENENDDMLMTAYEHWKSRRMRKGQPLPPTVKTEKKLHDPATERDPYVAFRRRFEKMTTRRNRKTDELSYERMLKLRRDFERVRTLLDSLRRREKYKLEGYQVDVELLERRHALGDYTVTELLPPPVPRMSLKNTIGAPGVRGLKKRKADDEATSTAASGAPRFTMRRLLREESDDEAEEEFLRHIPASALDDDSGDIVFEPLRNFFKLRMARIAQRHSQGATETPAAGAGDDDADLADDEEDEVVDDLDWECETAFELAAAAAAAASRENNNEATDEGLPLLRDRFLTSDFASVLPPSDSNDPFAFVRQRNCSYHPPRHHMIAPPIASHAALYRPVPFGRSGLIPLGVRRIGRGGRVIYDRATSAIVNPRLRQLQQRGQADGPPPIEFSDPFIQAADEFDEVHQRVLRFAPNLLFPATNPRTLLWPSTLAHTQTSEAEEATTAINSVTAVGLRPMDVEHLDQRPTAVPLAQQHYELVVGPNGELERNTSSSLYASASAAQAAAPSAAEDACAPFDPAELRSMPSLFSLAIRDHLRQQRPPPPLTGFVM
ncbi:EPC1 protein [Capsaspora owczarzaki ATCC 30864]|uniref:Enhancer of polycomb-like protein n=1 Tax=Capsaspora owczarzaki (strain ATCC 30864) TaxID=595528 RepID=A0A0D2U4J7_CAPO3|nr:EPC1 protein [Capsaspora owczarzaki ATCC 30864]KJE90071.1 EPC1 protein [Capsaspora owczarzaki ATCC 30864]|eukprot:XP_004364314.1 EPC1 protein [Capsaspora owczarzaki ATCC 30864]